MDSPLKTGQRVTIIQPLEWTLGAFLRNPNQHSIFTLSSTREKRKDFLPVVYQLFDHHWFFLWIYSHRLQYYNVLQFLLDPDQTTFPRFSWPTYNVPWFLNSARFHLYLWRSASLVSLPGVWSLRCIILYPNRCFRTSGELAYYTPRSSLAFRSNHVYRTHL